MTLGRLPIIENISLYHDQYLVGKLRLRATTISADGPTRDAVLANYELLACGDFMLGKADADQAMAEADVSPSTSRDGQAQVVCVPKEAILPSTNAVDRHFRMSSATVRCHWEGMQRRRTTANTGR